MGSLTHTQPIIEPPTYQSLQEHVAPRAVVAPCPLVSAVHPLCLPSISKQSFIADPFPFRFSVHEKLLKLSTINNEVSFTQITPNAD